MYDYGNASIWSWVILFIIAAVIVTVAILVGRSGDKNIKNNKQNTVQDPDEF